EIVIPDVDYPIDFDHAAVRPIPPEEQLAAGNMTAVEVQVESEIDIVSGALDRGPSSTGTRRVASNQAAISIVPEVAAIAPPAARSHEKRLPSVLLDCEMSPMRLLLRRQRLRLREQSRAEMAAIGDEIASIADERDRIRRELAEAGRAAPIDVLAGTFELHA